MSSRVDSRRSIGTVTSVSATQFVVELSGGSDSFTLVGFDGQHYVARVGSFVLIPLQDAYVVAEIVGLREREVASPRAPDREVHDIDGLNSSKYLDVVPVGMLPFRDDQPFKFGVTNYPPLYADALYTQTADLDRIFEVSDVEPLVDGNDPDGPTSFAALEIGTSVAFEGYKVRARIDEFFGGHSAILGNTGSGKSCTVASILQSIFTKGTPNAARGAAFVILDTNGEYRQAFSELPNPIRRTYGHVQGNSTESVTVVATDAGESVFDFRLPHWFFSVEEWELLLRASDRTQKPILRTALGLTSLFAAADSGSELGRVKNHVLASTMRSVLATSENDTAAASRILGLVAHFEAPAITRGIIEPITRLHYGQFTQRDSLDGLLDENIDASVTIPEYENRPFAFEVLGEALDLAILYEESHGNRHIRDFCSSLLTRFESTRRRKEFRCIRPDPASLQSHESTADVFTDRLLGLEGDSGQSVKRTQVTILDLSQVDDEVVEVVSAVATRLIFERLRRAPHRNSLPVNLVLEEAHRYVAEQSADFAIDAVGIFERVAKEGRKYGLFLLLASQRPSELSRTVLSQCSNFVIHRIQNPEDLQHVRRMTPFISDSVLGRLPALPKQHALIFGNAVTVPVTFRVRDASPRPRSDDAHVSRIWFADPIEVTNPVETTR